MTNNRGLAAAFGVLSVAWVLLGHTVGFFIGLPAFILWMEFVTLLLLLIFTPAVMFKARWTALGAVIVGVIRIIWDILGLASFHASLLYGPAVALVLVLFFTYFAFRGYQQK
jgi:hypothetical protein